MLCRLGKAEASGGWSSNRTDQQKPLRYGVILVSGQLWEARVSGGCSWMKEQNKSPPGTERSISYWGMDFQQNRNIETSGGCSYVSCWADCGNQRLVGEGVIWCAYRTIVRPLLTDASLRGIGNITGFSLCRYQSLLWRSRETRAIM